MTSVFPSVLKTAKVVLVFKKDSKLDYNNYSLNSLLSNIEKILENLVSQIVYLSHIITFIIYSLDLDKNIIHLMP